MIEKIWKTIDGEVIKDLVGIVRPLMVGKGREIHIGSDSQQAGRFTEFVTILVVLEKGKGGRAFYIREKTPRVKSLRERLMKEVWMSVTMGMELNAHIPQTAGLLIHIDANPDIRFASSTYVKELTGMVVGQGFKSVLKPDAWCASHAADHVVKHKILGM
jgi:predicted RNase H-related nuclease YkuK (DUF458 family)